MNLRRTASSKFLLVLFAWLFLSTGLILGQDTIAGYYNSFDRKCDKESASYYRVVKPSVSGLWLIRDFHMNGQLQMEGTYSDKSLKKQQGSAIFYHPNGKIAAKGQYFNNKEVGLWYYYFQNGRLSSEGKHKNGKLDSIWTYYHLNGSIFGNKTFKDGKPVGESTWYFESGKVSEVLSYKQGLVYKRSNYDENGIAIPVVLNKFELDFEAAKELILKTLFEQIVYPQELQGNGIQGSVLINFIIRKNGTIDGVEIQKFDDPLFNSEVLRVFGLIKSVKPIWYHGQCIDLECTLPVRFKLPKF